MTALLKHEARFLAPHREELDLNVPRSLLKRLSRPYGVEDNIFSNSAIRGGRSWVTISQRMSKSTLS